MRGKLLLATLATMAVCTTTSVVDATSVPASQTPNNPQAQLTPAQQAISAAKQHRADAAMARITPDPVGKSSATTVQSAASTINYVVLGVQLRVENPDWNCGPAATYQAAKYVNPATLYYQSSSDNPNNEPASYNLATLEGTTQASGTNCVNIPGPLNQAAGTGSYYIGSNITSESTLINDVVFDVGGRYPQVADVSTSALDYYNGAEYYHYITGDGYEQVNPNDGSPVYYTNAHVVDDNWNSAYSGLHWTSFNGLSNAISYFGSNVNYVW